MSIFHLNIKTLGRSQGRSATGAAAYRAGVRITDLRTGMVFDYTRKRGVDSSEIITPDGSSVDRADVWNQSEQCDRRIDAQCCREVEFALPVELDPEQMRRCVRLFVREQFTAMGMVADIAFHHLTGSNPHAHVLLSMREWSGGKFGLKRRDWNDRSLCLRWRERWAHHANEALAAAGHNGRIDHRSLIEQAQSAAGEGRISEAIALDREPTLHERGSPTVAARNQELRRLNSARLSEWAQIEQEAERQARLMEPVADQPRSRAARLAAEDLAFEADMRSRTDRTASRWKFYDDIAKEEAAWLEARVGVEASRLSRLDRARCAVAEARESRRSWAQQYPKPPFWRFWQRPAWVRGWTRKQAEVEKAKRILLKAAKKGDHAAISAWRRAIAGRQAEHARALASRRAMALTPSERTKVLPVPSSRLRMKEPDLISTPSAKLAVEVKSSAVRPRPGPRR